jgi:hypothetical protein
MMLKNKLVPAVFIYFISIFSTSSQAMIKYKNYYKFNKKISKNFFPKNNIPLNFKFAQFSSTSLKHATFGDFLLRAVFKRMETWNLKPHITLPEIKKLESDFWNETEKYAPEDFLLKQIKDIEKYFRDLERYNLKPEYCHANILLNSDLLYELTKKCPQKIRDNVLIVEEENRVKLEEDGVTYPVLFDNYQRLIKAIEENREK